MTQQQRRIFAQIYICIFTTDFISNVTLNISAIYPSRKLYHTRNIFTNMKSRGILFSTNGTHNCIHMRFGA